MRLLRFVPYLSLVALLAIGWRAYQYELPPLPAIDEGQTATGVENTPRATPARWLTGQLVDEQGLPLEAALVCLASGEPVLFDHTDAAGRFQIFEGVGTGEMPAQIKIDVLAEGFRPESFEFATGQEVVVRMSERWDPAPELGMPESSTAEFRLQGGAAAGYKGCELLLLPTRAIEGPEDPSPTTLRRALVDESGRIQIERVIAGRYHLLLLPRWAAGGSWPNLLCSLDGPAPELSFPLAGEEVIQVAAVDGHASLNMTDGALHLAVEGATVLLSAEVGGQRRHWPLVQSDARGSIRLADLPPGTYALKIQAGLRVLERELVTRAGETLELGRLELPEVAPAH
ncbi:MAG: hypothetical protein ACI835_000939 [Planctomycetota bacterium]|jgi:hypothetical protein